jgi:hypothetical protein
VLAGINALTMKKRKTDTMQCFKPLSAEGRVSGAVDRRTINWDFRSGKLNLFSEPLV